MGTSAQLLQLTARSGPRQVRYSAELGLYPSSWYCVGFAADLRRGAVLTQVLAGQTLVIFRTESGVAAAVEAYCPHLGAHLGHGGRVEGETIRCPFHGFCFDAAGTCTKTGYGTRPPPNARLQSWPIIERSGVLFVYFDAAARAPTWEIPDLDMSGWTRLRHRGTRFRGHPQEVAENSVDIGHFTYVHHYEDVRELSRLRTDGAYLNARYAMRSRRQRLLGVRDISFEFEIHQYGLGCALVEVSTSIGVLTRQWVLVTPLGGDEVELRIACAIRRSDTASPLLSLVPASWLAEFTIREYARDVGQDLGIWANKKYMNPPALAAGDGPIGAYRKWARQFYVNAQSQTTTSDDDSQHTHSRTGTSSKEN